MSNWDDIKRLVREALGRPEGDRLAFIRHACGGDGELLSSVLGIIEAFNCDDEDTDWLKIQPTLLHEAIAERPRDIPTDRIGNYRIISVLGEGGMGTVYLAEQDQPRRQVALKVMKGGLYSPSTLRRFEFECEVLGQLQHAGIAQIYQAGTFDSGAGPQPYFAMEFIDGCPLTAFASAKALTIRQRLEQIARIAESVQHAHSRGVVHLDLKPANILVDAGGQAKIVDFGVARLAPGEGAGSTLAAPHSTTIGGTAAYMSPEQAAGEQRSIDARSDVYSLGVVTYELLTGRSPYAALNDPNRTPGLYEVLRIVCESEPTMLTRAAAWGGGSGRVFAGDIEAIVHKALQREREQRYATAGEFAEDLRNWLDHRPVKARKPSTWYHARKFARRHPGLVTGVTTTIVALAGGLIATTESFRQRAIVAEANQRRLGQEAAYSLAQAAQRGDWTTALRACDDALAYRHPDEIGLRLRRVEALISLGRSRKALEEIESLREREDLGHYRGAVLLWAADIGLMQNLSSQSAEKMINKSLQAGLDPADEAYARAMVAPTTPDAVLGFQQALERDPFHHRARSMLAAALVLLGRFDEAQPHLGVLQNTFPDDPLFTCELAFLSALRQDMPRARAVIDEARPKIGPELADVLVVGLEFVERVNEVFNGERPDLAAKQLLAEAMSVVARIMPYYKKISALQGSAHGPEDMLGFSVRFPPFLSRGIGGIAEVAGRLLLSSGTVDDEAREALAHAVAAHPDGLLRFFQGVLLREAGDVAGAEEAFRLAAETPSLLDIRRPALFQAAGAQWVLAGQDGNSPQLEWKQRSIDTVRELLSRGEPRLYQAPLLVNITLQAGEYDLARTIVAGLEHRAPRNPEVLWCRAQVEYHAGAYGTAILASDALLALNPTSTDVKQLRQESVRLLGHIGPPNSAVSKDAYLRSTAEQTMLLTASAPAMPIMSPSFTRDTPEILIMKQGMAGRLIDQENYVAAEPILRRVLEQKRASLGDEHASVAVAMNDLGLCLRHLSKFEEAEDLLRQALAMTRKLRGSTDPEVGTVLWNLADVLYARGNYTEAEPLLREALSILAKGFPKSHPNLASLKAQLGRVLVRQICTNDLSAVGATTDPAPELPDQIARLREAEEFLHPAYEILSAAPNAKPRIVRSALEGMVELCEAWQDLEPDKGYDAKATGWRSKLNDYQASTQRTVEAIASPAPSGE